MFCCIHKAIANHQRKKVKKIKDSISNLYNHAIYLHQIHQDLLMLLKDNAMGMYSASPEVHYYLNEFLIKSELTLSYINELKNSIE